MRIAGIDPSVRSTGLARVDGKTITVVGPPVPKRASVGERADRLVRIAEGVLEALRANSGPELVVFEGYGLASKGGYSAAYNAELGGLLRAELRSLFRCELVEVPPSSLKLWATGTGNATKDEMLEAARARGAMPRGHDEADAYLLRAWGIELLELIDASSPSAREDQNPTDTGGE